MLRTFGANITGPSRIYPGARVWIPSNLTINGRSSVADGAYIYNIAPVVIAIMLLSPKEPVYVQEPTIIIQLTLSCFALLLLFTMRFGLLPTALFIPALPLGRSCFGSMFRDSQRCCFLGCLCRESSCINKTAASWLIFHFLSLLYSDLYVL